jgi:hypothetical protein
MLKNVTNQREASQKSQNNQQMKIEQLHEIDDQLQRVTLQSYRDILVKMTKGERSVREAIKV